MNDLDIGKLQKATADLRVALEQFHKALLEASSSTQSFADKVREHMKEQERRRTGEKV